MSLIQNAAMDKKLDHISTLGVMFFLGWIAAMSYYKIPFLWDKQHALTQLDQCEHWRASKATAVAKQAIGSATSDYIPIPDISQIPKDCPHVKIDDSSIVDKGKKR